jgi:hypothetical protein
MNRDQAREILALHRGGPPADAETAEALRFAVADDELREWLRQQQELHKLVGAEIRSIEPPDGLQAKILARAAAPEKPVSLTRKYSILAMAASIAILFAAVTFWFSKDRDVATFENFHSRMTSFALRTYQMDVVTNKESVVRELLATRGAPADFPLTPALRKVPVLGGGKLSWQNHPVAMMCFTLPSKQTAFMFVVDEKNVAGEKPATPAVMTGPGLNAVSWTENGRVYLLAAAEKPEVLAGLARR